MSKSRYIGLWVSARMYEQIQNQAMENEMSVSEVVRLSVSRHVMDPELRSMREVTIGRNSWPDKALEYLASRTPVVTDLYTGKHLEVNLRNTLREKLSRTQARRLEARLLGKRFEDIAAEEGCSKQAVHMSIKRAVQSLKNDREFLQALCLCFPDSGLGPEILMEAL